MDPELRQTLLEIKALAKDNHDLLKSMRQHQWISMLTSVIFWIVVVALPLYLYQKYMAPIVASITGTGDSSSTFGLPSSEEFQKLIDSFRAGQGE